MKAYYQDEKSGMVIYHGDFRKVVAALDRRVDVVVTDPPYGETNLQWDKWPQGWLKKALTISDQLWCFGSMRMFLKHQKEFAAWKFAQEIIWEKQNGSGLHNDRFRRVHEIAAHFYAKTAEWNSLYHAPVYVNDARKRSIHRQTKPAHWGENVSKGFFEVEEGGPRMVRSVIYCKSCHRMAEHPTQKPEGIIYPLIEYSCPPNGTVLDCFMGSGTTLAVAKQLGRRAIGVDSDEANCEIAARRLSQSVLSL